MTTPTSSADRTAQYLTMYPKEGGARITSYVVGIHGDSLEDLVAKAASEYPETITMEQDADTWNTAVQHNLFYDPEKKELVLPPEPTEEEKQQAAYREEAYTAQSALNNITTRAMRMTLAGSGMQKIQAEYQAALMDISDGAALEMTDYFPEWVGNGHEYAAGDRVMYKDILYKVLQAHTSQETWTPTDAPSLFAKVLINGTEETPPEWEQPGADNAYMTGDRVTYQGKVYESTVDNNVWAPDAYPQGWKEIKD